MIIIMFSYKNIGGKIRGLAKACFILRAIFYAFCGLTAIGIGTWCTRILASDAELTEIFGMLKAFEAIAAEIDLSIILADKATFENFITTLSIGSFIVGFATIIIGILVSWFSTWSLYGFGELIAKVTSIDSKINRR